MRLEIICLKQFQNEVPEGLLYQYDMLIAKMTSFEVALTSLILDPDVRAEQQNETLQSFDTEVTPQIVARLATFNGMAGCLNVIAQYEGALGAASVLDPGLVTEKRQAVNGLKQTLVNSNLTCSRRLTNLHNTVSSDASDFVQVVKKQDSGPGKAFIDALRSIGWRVKHALCCCVGRQDPLSAPRSQGLFATMRTWRKRNRQRKCLQRTEKKLITALFNLSKPPSPHTSR